MISLRENIIEVLMNCYDPEIPLDLWSLGLIYDINISNDEAPKKKVDIVMSLTTPGCSMGQQMANDIKSKVVKLGEVETVDVEITFDPPWNPKMMTDDAREKLGFDAVNSTKKTQKIKTEWD